MKSRLSFSVWGLFVAIVLVYPAAHGESPKGKAPSAPGPGDLIIDLRAGTPSEAVGGESPELQRLRALAFTINSLNIGNQNLLKVDEVLKSHFPPDGQIPKTGEATLRIPLSPFLTPKQIDRLRKILLDEPLACRDSAAPAKGVRVDLLAKAVFSPTNYNQLMLLNDSRKSFEIDWAVAPEFDIQPEFQDKSKNTQRLLIAPGQSGVVHSSAIRKIVLQKMSYGGLGLLLARSEDSEYENAAKSSHNHQLFPVSARGDAHEEIWELPNGFRAYALRNAQGKLQTNAGPNLVTAKIVNPLACMNCHATGFIATTGKGKSLPLDELKTLKVEDEGGVGQSLFTATFKGYNKTIAAANERYLAALKASGAGATKNLGTFIDGYGEDVSPSDLATELGVPKEELFHLVQNDPTLGKLIDRSAWTKAIAAGKEPPAVTRADLERSVSTGGIPVPLFCALKARLDAQAKGLAKAGCRLKYKCRGSDEVFSVAVPPEWKKSCESGALRTAKLQWEPTREIVPGFTTLDWHSEVKGSGKYGAFSGLDVSLSPLKGVCPVTVVTPKAKQYFEKYGKYHFVSPETGKSGKGVGAWESWEDPVEIVGTAPKALPTRSSIHCQCQTESCYTTKSGWLPEADRVFSFLQPYTGKGAPEPGVAGLPPEANDSCEARALAKAEAILGCIGSSVTQNSSGLVPHCAPTGWDATAAPADAAQPKQKGTH